MEWESLRKQASQIESEVDKKLVSLSKVGAAYSHRADASRHDSSSPSEHSQLLGLRDQNDQLAQTYSAEIQKLLGEARLHSLAVFAAPPTR